MNVADEHLKGFADLKRTLMDYGEISADLTAPQRVDAAEGIVKGIREFEMLGYVVNVGTARDYRVRGEEWPYSVMAAFKKPTGMLRVSLESYAPSAGTKSATKLTKYLGPNAKNRGKLEENLMSLPTHRLHIVPDT